MCSVCRYLTDFFLSFFFLFSDGSLPSPTLPGRLTSGRWHGTWSAQATARQLRRPYYATTPVWLNNGRTEQAVMLVAHTLLPSMELNDNSPTTPALPDVLSFRRLLQKRISSPLFSLSRIDTTSIHTRQNGHTSPRLFLQSYGDE